MNNILEVRNLAISFGGIHAVQDVSFNVETGEILGLIGPNGSGKSTCINLITGVYAPDRGEVVFNGSVISDKMSIDRRAHLGMGRTFQSPRPFGHMDVFNNIYSIALQRYSHAQAREKTEHIIALTQLDGWRSLLSSKLPIEKRKWLDLARILATDPKLIMMDEVLAGLNHIEMEDSLALVKKINSEGISILFIEHVMKAVVSLCRRVVVLNEGKLLAEGDPSEVLHRDEVVKAYIGGGPKNAAS